MILVTFEFSRTYIEYTNVIRIQWCPIRTYRLIHPKRTLSMLFMLTSLLAGNPPKRREKNEHSHTHTHTQSCTTHSYDSSTHSKHFQIDLLYVGKKATTKSICLYVETGYEIFGGKFTPLIFFFIDYDFSMINRIICIWKCLEFCALTVFYLENIVVKAKKWIFFWMK